VVGAVGYPSRISQICIRPIRKTVYKNLSEYIRALERAGELVRVAAEVDPELEIAELTDRES